MENFGYCLLDPSQKRCPTQAKTLPNAGKNVVPQVQEWIFAFCQGGQAFDEASVLLRYSTQVKSAAQRWQKQKDTLHLGPAVGADEIHKRNGIQGAALHFAFFFGHTHKALPASFFPHRNNHYSWVGKLCHQGLGY